jgi:hypothetical protein
MERRGVPTITVITERFVGLAHAIAESLERTDLSMVVIPHPFGGQPEAEVRHRAGDVAERMNATLMAWVPPTTMASTGQVRTRPDMLEIELEADDEVSFALDRLGLTDGLPVVPPAANRVRKMLQFTGVDPRENLGPIPPSGNMLTLRAAAANAVMAGCRPEYFPVVLQALAALMSSSSLNLSGMQTTTHPIGPMVMLSGPIAREIDVVSGVGCLGPGWPANATIGRAVRLILMNAGEARPGGTDRATMGQPGKFSFCFSENESESPWEPYRVERGYSTEATTVTVVGAEAPHNINDHGSTDAEGLLRTIAGTMATTGNNNLYWLGDTFLILGPEHAAQLAREGLSKRDVKNELHARARIPAAAMSTGQFSHLSSWIAEAERSRFVDPEGRVALVRHPDDIHIVVAGGPGKHSMWVPTWFRSNTIPMMRSDGSLARSVREVADVPSSVT